MLSGRDSEKNHRTSKKETVFRQERMRYEKI